VPTVLGLAKVRDFGGKQSEDGKAADNCGSCGAAETSTGNYLSPHFQARTSLCEVEQAVRSLSTVGIGAMDFQPFAEL